MAKCKRSPGRVDELISKTSIFFLGDFFIATFDDNRGYPINPSDTFRWGVFLVYLVTWWNTDTVCSRYVYSVLVYTLW